MRYHTLIIVVLLVAGLCLGVLGDARVARAQPPTIAWLHQFGTDSWDYANDVAVDGSGNGYVVGMTSGALPDQTNLGSYDAFIRKYDSSGNPLWTDQFGSSSEDYALGVAVDGSAYVVGNTGGALPDQTNLGGRDAFIRKYDSSGNELWTRQFGTSDSDIAMGVAVDGSAYVVGDTDGALPDQTNLGMMPLSASMKNMCHRHCHHPLLHLQA